MTWNAELKQIKDMINGFEEKLVTFDTRLQVFQQLINEDRVQLETSSRQMSVGNASEMQEQLRQQAQLIRELQTEFVSQTKALTALQVASTDWSKTADSMSAIQGDFKILRAGSEKNHAELNLKHSALSKDISDLRVQLAASGPTGEADKELRKLIETKFAQQEQTNQALRRDVTSLDETTTELRLTPSSAGQSQTSFSEVDALKHEVAEQRKLQASELQHEADDLHRHIDSVVQMERQARTEENSRFHTVLDLLRKEVDSLSESARRGSGSGAASIPAQFECINPKLLDVSQRIDPKFIEATRPSVPMSFH